jgi:parvulin-like peptidyl-prolyl isomerase
MKPLWPRRPSPPARSCPWWWIAAACGCLASALPCPSSAQGGSPWSGVRPPGSPAAPAPSVPPNPAPSPVRAKPLPDTALVARVNGRPITRLAYDRLGEPYFERLRAQLGPGLTPEILKAARLNVLNELVRREVLAIEAQRQKIQPSDAEVDSLLMRDPFFLTGGVFDPLKFNQFKLAPTSNYHQVLPTLREAAAIEKLDRALRRRLRPSPAAVKAEWAKRNDQVTFQYLPLLLRDVSLEPEATEAEWAAHFRAHAEEYAKRTQLRLRAYRLPLPPEADSTRAAAESAALTRGRRMADSLEAGTLPDSSASTVDTGLFDVPGLNVPVLGRVPGLLEALAKADTVPSVRVVGPFAGGDAVIVGKIVERHPRHVPPMREVLGAVKRRADAEKRQAASEADRRAFYDAHLERYRGPRARLTRLVLDESAYRPRDVPGSEIEAWYKASGRSLFGESDTSKAWMPPLTDSLRGVVRRKIEDSERGTWMGAALAKLASGLSAGRSPRELVRASGASAETLTIARWDTPDSLFSGLMMDSLLESAPGRRGKVEGPRRFGRRSAVWRVDSADTTFVPPYDRVRLRVAREFADERRAREEADGRVWFDAHRDRYRIPVQRAIEYVSVAIPPVDSVRLSEAELRAAYQKNLAAYHQEEQVHARHILLTTGAGISDQKAKARADSLRKAAMGGADFTELARRFSQEPGASASGGDLGWFGRGRMVKEFETAAFALKPGEVSAVVKTQFGYHVIRLEERKPAGTKAFAEVKEDIRSQLATSRADSAAARAAATLARKLALGGDARALAATHGGVQTSTPFGANDPVPGVGMVPNLSAALPKMPAGRWSVRTFRTGRAYLVVRPKAATPARAAEFDEVRAQAVEDAKNAKREELLEKKVSALRASLAAGASLDSLAAPYGGLKSSGPVSRIGGFVPGLGAEARVVERAFTLPPGGQSDTLITTQGRVWIRLENRKQPDAKSFAAAREALTEELLKKNLDEWLEARKKTMRIEVLRRDLKEAEQAGALAGGR